MLQFLFFLKSIQFKLNNNPVASNINKAKHHHKKKHGNIDVNKCTKHAEFIESKGH
jgi:hypothetical protein